MGILGELIPRLGGWRLAAVLTGLGLLLPGCAAVGPEQQRLVSKPNMVFSESVVFGYSSKLLSQTEPGSAFTGTLQSSGCTSCK